MREGGGVTLNYKSIRRHLSPWPGQICKVNLRGSVISVNFLQNSLENIFGSNTVYWNLNVPALYSVLFLEKVFKSPLLWRWRFHEVREYSLSQLSLCMELFICGGLASVLFDTFPVIVHYQNPYNRIQIITKVSQDTWLLFQSDKVSGCFSLAILPNICIQYSIIKMFIYVLYTTSWLQDRVFFKGYLSSHWCCDLHCESFNQKA